MGEELIEYGIHDNPAAGLFNLLYKFRLIGTYAAFSMTDEATPEAMIMSCIIETKDGWTYMWPPELYDSGQG